jgi:capsular polysaccharide biosynthesis protein
MEKDNKVNSQAETEKNDLKNKPNPDFVSIDIKNIFRILKKRKWWFIVTFIIVFCSIFSFTYFVTPESKYSIQSTMLLTTDNIRYQEKVNYYFPKEAYDLWLIASEAYPLNSLNYYYMDAISYIYSEKVINMASQKLDGLFNKEIIKRSIVASKSLDGTQLDISISYKNKNDTKKIADAVLGSFIENRKSDFEVSSNELLKKINEKNNNLSNDISSLMKQADDYSFDFNTRIVNELKTLNANQINFYISDYIPPDIKVKLDADNDQLANLKDIKSNLEGYKNLYIDRIVLNTNDNIIANINILKNLILSIAAGIIFGFIFAFGANYYKSN